MPEKHPAPDETPTTELGILPLTPDRWPDLETLFGKQGAFAGCWCMWWRMTGKKYGQRTRDERKEAFKGVVERGEVPGLLAYADGEPVGWCAIAPRDDYERLRSERLRIFKKVDEQPVWTVTCFYVKKPYRRQGVTTRLLHAAVEHAKSRGAAIIEGYPIDTEVAGVRDEFAYTGVLSTFQKAGFVEVLRRHEKRPIVRYFVKE